MSFTHVKREETLHAGRIHISHLYEYVSAYVMSKEEVDFLVNMLETALVQAKSSGQTQIVDRDGEFCFHVTPAGYITLMIPWKTFIVDRE